MSDHTAGDDTAGSAPPAGDDTAGSAPPAGAAKQAPRPLLKALDPPTVPFAVGGIILWALIGLILLLFRGWLADHGRTGWLWICLAGFILGFPGLATMLRHDRLRRARRAAEHHAAEHDATEHHDAEYHAAADHNATEHNATERRDAEQHDA